MTFTIGGWQIAWVVLIIWSITIHAVNHGKIRTDKYSIWTALVSAAIEFTILYNGGFFMKIN
jgi:hypothetical protein